MWYFHGHSTPQSTVRRSSKTTTSVSEALRRLKSSGATAESGGRFYRLLGPGHLAEVAGLRAKMLLDFRTPSRQPEAGPPQLGEGGSYGDD